MMVQNSIDNKDLEVVDGSMEVIMHTSREDEYVFEEKDFNYNVDEELHQVVELEAKEGCSLDSNATILWKHVIKGRKCGNAHGGSHVFKCKHCKKVYNGSYTRVFAHLMGHKKGENKGIGYCPVVKADVNLQQLLKRQVEQIESSPNVVPLKKSKLKLASSSISSHGPSPAISLPPSPSSPTGLLEKSVQIEEKEDVDSKVLRFLCANGISLNVLRSPYWEDMIKAISKVPGYESPSYDKARTVLLHNERQRVERSLDDFKEKWSRYGISIISNGWAKVKKQPLINTFASNQCGSIFLDARDSLVVEKCGKNVSRCLLEAIKSVGADKIAQVITDDALNCKIIGDEIGKEYPHIFYNTCVLRTLKLIFKDLAIASPWLEKTYTTSKNIVKFIMNHPHALQMFLSNSKLETLKVAMTRFASFYTCMKRLFDVKEALRDMVVSDQWKAWESLPVLDTKVKLIGADVRAEVMSDEFWESVQLALLMTKPMYRMIKFIDQEGPLIGELYDNMENMIVEIRDNLREAEFDIHSNVEKIVHNRWNKVDAPLHCLAHALTPKYYDEEFLQNAAPGVRKRGPPDQDIDIMDSAMAAIFKMHSDIDQADTIRVQLMSFLEKKGRFSTPTAKRDARNPKISVLEWWKFHGGDTKELRDMAFRVLSQPITTSVVERVWSTYGFIHDMKRNRLNAGLADSFVYIHSNLRILSRSQAGYNIGPHRKWDVNPEHPIVDDSLAKWEDMRFDGLDEGSVLEPSPQPCNSMEEHDDMTLGEDSFLHSSDSYKRGEGCASVQGRRGRGRFGGSHNFSSKGKAKMN